MLINPIKKLVRNRKGATAIEYGLIAAMIVITMIAALAGVANTTTTMWGDVDTKVRQAVNG